MRKRNRRPRALSPPRWARPRHDDAPGLGNIGRHTAAYRSRDIWALHGATTPIEKCHAVVRRRIAIKHPEDTTHGHAMNVMYKQVRHIAPLVADVALPIVQPVRRRRQIQVHVSRCDRTRCRQSTDELAQALDLRCVRTRRVWLLRLAQNVCRPLNHRRRNASRLWRALHQALIVFVCAGTPRSTPGTGTLGPNIGSPKAGLSANECPLAAATPLLLANARDNILRSTAVGLLFHRRVHVLLALEAWSCSQAAPATPSLSERVLGNSSDEGRIRMGDHKGLHPADSWKRAGPP